MFKDVDEKQISEAVKKISLMDDALGNDLKILTKYIEKLEQEIKRLDEIIIDLRQTKLF